MRIPIRRLLVPTALAAILSAPLSGTLADPPKDVVDTAIAAGNFKSLVAALRAADLVTQLRGPGPYTVFAPTDEAFARIPKGDLDALLKDKAKLTRVLTHHVFAGNANSGDLGMLKDLSVADGGRLTIEKRAGSLKVDGAKVIQADIAVSNGIIHVIDAVLLP